MIPAKNETPNQRMLIQNNRKTAIDVRTIFTTAINDEWIMFM